VTTRTPLCFRVSTRLRFLLLIGHRSPHYSFKD
jgi:hypothetical protein